MTQDEDFGAPATAAAAAAAPAAAVTESVSTMKEGMAKAQDGLSSLSQAGMENGQIMLGNLKARADNFTASIETSFSKASEGLTELNIKAVDALRENVNSAFELWERMIGARTMMQVFELQSEHARKRVETLGEQSHDLSALAQRVARESFAPVQASLWSVHG